MRQTSMMAPAKSSCDPMTQNPKRPTPTVLFAGLMVTVMCAALHAEPQVAQVQDDAIVEVTTQDFTTLPKIVSSQLSTFGIRFGMNRAEVAAAVGKHCPTCSMRNREHLTLTGLVKDGEVVITSEGEELPAATVIFSQDLVESIQWMANMRNHLAGQSKKLLTPEAYTLDSPVRLELLGREDTFIPVTVGGSNNPGWHHTFVYEKEGLKLEEYNFRIKVPGIKVENKSPVMRITLTKAARIR